MYINPFVFIRILPHGFICPLASCFPPAGSSLSASALLPLCTFSLSFPPHYRPSQLYYQPMRVICIHRVQKDYPTAWVQFLTLLQQSLYLLNLRKFSNDDQRTKNTKCLNLECFLLLTYLNSFYLKWNQSPLGGIHKLEGNDFNQWPVPLFSIYSLHILVSNFSALWISTESVLH